jgi:general secretion pathway protein G
MRTSNLQKVDVLAKHRYSAVADVALVIVIFLFFVAISLPRIGRASSPHPELLRTKKGLAAIHSALTAFKSKMGYFPGSDQGLDVLIDPPFQGKSAMNWKGPYLARDKSQFMDPWNTKYVYRLSGSSTLGEYVLFSCGPDGIEGTEDDVGK